MPQFWSTTLTVIGWMAGLIFAYLLLKNATGAKTIGDSIASGANTLTKTLQGR